MKPDQFRKAIIRIAAMRPRARAHMDGFMRGGGVQNDLGLSGLAACFSR